MRAADREDSGDVAGKPRARRAQMADEPEPTPRDRKPSIPIRESIDQYTEGELLRIVQWIASDGLLRTDDQIVDEMIEMLGFERRGARIVATISGAVALFRRSA